MSRKNKKTGVVAVALTAAVAIILVSSVAYGHWRSDNQDLGRINLGQWNERVPSQYSMNPDQLVQTENVLFDCWEEMLPLQRKLSSLELEARLYSDSPDVDPDQVQSYGHQINDVQDEITALRQRANAGISSDTMMEWYMAMIWATGAGGIPINKAIGRTTDRMAAAGRYSCFRSQCGRGEP